MGIRGEFTAKRLGMLLAFVLIAAMAAGQGAAGALDWPKKAIQIIVPFPPRR